MRIVALACFGAVIVDVTPVDSATLAAYRSATRGTHQRLTRCY